MRRSFHSKSFTPGRRNPGCFFIEAHSFLRGMNEIKTAPSLSTNSEKGDILRVYANTPPRRIHYSCKEERHGSRNDQDAPPLLRMERARCGTSALRRGARYAGTGTTGCRGSQRCVLPFDQLCS